MPVKILLLFFLLCMSDELLSQNVIKEPLPSDKPSAYQLQQINRKYGMFIHFGINTFYDEEWTDGSKPPLSYKPLSIDADQWIRVAKEAGMKYVIMVSKHVDGFCLWDSRYTDYDVASSSNTTNVIEKKNTIISGSMVQPAANNKIISPQPILESITCSSPLPLAKK